jgi:aquaporin Z
MEAALLAVFMMSAATFATLLQHPASPLFVGPGAAVSERVPMGLAMGLTAIVLIYSPWGVRSGAHMNPAVTLTFWRLNRITTHDAVFYVVAQVVGGVAGIGGATALLAQLPAHPAINYVATVPGDAGAAAASVAEFVISCGLMLVVLGVSSSRRHAALTGVAAGALVALFIVVEAPLSGMSMNPARSLGPALYARTLDTMWVYVLGPTAGMLTAAEVYRRLNATAVGCAKLHHPAHVRCIHCGGGADAPDTVRSSEKVTA